MVGVSHLRHLRKQLMRAVTAEATIIDCAMTRAVDLVSGTTSVGLFSDMSGI
jgi:hypothetical protein